MMKTLLRKLYNGELCPIEQIVSKETAYRPVNRQITEAMGVWRKRLDESEYKELENLLNLRAQAGEMDLAASFEYGFQLGVSLMVEALAGRKDMLKEGK
ncbi:hypothetical protein B1748_33590 [Paenibacillus sp. MY03]|uniref:DUF6809 family protein n=1 Tax=Paenibacillus sp. MY03 TaxID=302980 RepID=UPI000B3C7B39|nr:DUF6809 family protein [Paenibacillus sp. MY03]OUS68562.1 hypothetical protein B1748_33590 [Paenibacillus sp. MY03]